MASFYSRTSFSAYVASCVVRSMAFKMIVAWLFAPIVAYKKSRLLFHLPPVFWSNLALPGMIRQQTRNLISVN